MPQKSLCNINSIILAATRVLVLFIPVSFPSACDKRAKATSPVTWTISASALGHNLSISSSPAFAGAISSLYWNGKEFINHDDHGRELQSAISFDGLGECYNPTEAGCEADKGSDTSTSKLLYFDARGNQISSSVQMAFWTSVNEAYPAGCGTDTSIKVAQNTTNLSNCILTKHIAIGFAGIANAIEYLVTFQVPEHHSSATFEALTGYLVQDFSTFLTFNPSSQSLKSLSAGPGEQDKPIIFCTPDSQYAMGIYSPDLPQSSFPYTGYGRFNFAAQNTMKWNAVFRTGDIAAGSYSFRLYLLIGSLPEVTSGMTSVYRKFYP